MPAEETAADGPAIRALGSLFSLSEVYLWDDAKASDSEVSDCIVNLEEDEEEPMENIELAHHMATLGLPVSFGTTKQRKTATPRKRKSVLVKCKLVYNDTENQQPGLLEVEQGKYSLPDFLPNSTDRTIEGECIASDSDTLEENSSGCVHVDSIPGCVSDTSVMISKATESQVCAKMVTSNHMVDEIQTSGTDLGAEDLYEACKLSPDILEDSSSGCYPASPSKQHPQSTYVNWEFGDWMIIWDDFYGRNYFYNSKTQETTWYAPPGLEYLTNSGSIYTSNGLSADAAQEHPYYSFDYDAAKDQDTNIVEDGSEVAEPLEFENANNLSSHSSAKTDDASGINSFASHLKIATDIDKHMDSLLMHHSASISDYAIEEDAVQHSDKLEDKPTFNESFDVPDEIFPLAISNCLSTSSNDVCYDRGTENSKVEQLDNNLDSTVIVKKESRERSHKPEPKIQASSGDISANIFKYWFQRYLLFSRYDRGIKMDEEGWFSVTPEAIARHQATRCGGGIVIDCFTGVGGNAIQFAMKSDHVIAIDIDPQKVEYAYHNSTIYGVNHKIDFIQGDFFKIAVHLKGETVFLSPPWGGPDYVKVQTYDLRTMLKPHDGFFLFKCATMVASRVVLFLPRNVDFNQLADLSLSMDPPWRVEVEKNILNGKFKAVTAYFSRT
ncbi:uncharacterized protein LOC122016164 [Zingiber officinale]|uniref:WW domain-containing protein n=1 Tax=Zingiber officinale TaxID=94328 RepID=A0A8J5KP70_ZINOF|nr:uncharacterized protein LOC122016164 [Zingiber officinale]KAG6483933.1 hypothetical protein ZIOFF_060726 [Zingiber officinale]